MYTIMIFFLIMNKFKFMIELFMYNSFYLIYHDKHYIECISISNGQKKIELSISYYWTIHKIIFTIL